VTIETVVHERGVGGGGESPLDGPEREHARLVPALDGDGFGSLSLRVRVAADEAERECLAEARDALDVA
jgi:hypothetical protein